MKKNQKLLILFILIMNILTNTIQAQTDSASFYLGGVQEWFYQQQDIYSFRKSDKSEFLNVLPSSIVLKREYEKNGTNTIYFNTNASTSDIQSVINTIVADPLFEREFMVLTKDWLSNFNENKYIPTNDILEVVFNNDNISISDVNSFAINHFLELMYRPTYGGVYIFKIKPIPELLINSKMTLERATEIWEQDMNIVKKVTPSLGLFHRKSTNDSLYNKMWHVENNGIVCYGSQGYFGASAKINTVWNLNDEFGIYQGYTGAGVTVAVIDYDGFQYSHPDMQGVFLPGTYISADTVFEFNSDTFSTNNEVVHGLAVSSIIAANANNNIGMAGVAYGAKIKPYLLPNLNVTFTHDLNIALSKCYDNAFAGGPNSIDVINMSFGSEFQGAIINASFLPLTVTIKKLNEMNKDNVVDKGVPMIASAGNGNGYNQFLPAMYEEVFSVGSTNPRDRRKSANYNANGWGIDYFSTADGFDEFRIDTITGDSMFKAWGSSYFIDMDVMAPGSSIPALSKYSSTTNGTTLYSGFDGFYSPNSQIAYFSGSSASAPIVSGIVALLLEKEPNLKAEQIYNALRNGAEKTGGYTYSDTLIVYHSAYQYPDTNYYYTENPKHMEMGYGRVNAYNTVFNTDTTINLHLDIDAPNITAINEFHKDFTYLFNNPTNNYLNIKLNKKGNYLIRISTLKGKLISNNNLINKNNISIDVKDLSKGLYFINIFSLETNSFVNSKFIKR